MVRFTYVIREKPDLRFHFSKTRFFVDRKGGNIRSFNEIFMNLRIRKSDEQSEGQTVPGELNPNGNHLIFVSIQFIFFLLRIKKLKKPHPSEKFSLSPNLQKSLEQKWHCEKLPSQVNRYPTIEQAQRLRNHAAPDVQRFFRFDTFLFIATIV